MTVIFGMNNVKIIILTIESISYLGLRMMVNDFIFGEVQWVACGRVLCEG